MVLLVRIALLHHQSGSGGLHSMSRRYPASPGGKTQKSEPSRWLKTCTETGRVRWGLKGGWCSFFFSGQSSTNTCSNWNILRWPIWSSNFRKKNIARTMWDDSWWMEKKQQGRLVSLFPPELISFSRRIPQLEAPIIFSVVHPMEGGYCPKSFLTSLIIWTHPNPLATKIQPGRSLKRAWLARLSR